MILDAAHLGKNTVGSVRFLGVIPDRLLLHFPGEEEFVLMVGETCALAVTAGIKFTYPCSQITRVRVSRPMKTNGALYKCISMMLLVYPTHRILFFRSPDMKKLC